MPDGAPLNPEEDRFAQRLPDHDTADEQEHEGYALDYEQSSEEPDVLLDVPVLKVDEIDLEVADLRARLSLHAEVLDLLKLHVGADVTLGRVVLKIKGVEAQALLKVRLDNVAAIIDRVLTTIDRNPQILEDVTRGWGTAVEQVGQGAGQAVEDIGEGGRDVAEGVSGRARLAVEDADATAEAPGRPGREARRGAGQAARRAPPRVPRTDQAEESPPQRSRRDQPQRSRPDERRRGRPDESQ